MAPLTWVRRARTISYVLVLVAAGAAPAHAQTPAGSGGFLSSLKQAFRQDTDKEVVRGHFDVGTPPDVHRYYCLVDPKSGKREPSGVGGEPVKRSDGTTGIQGATVSFHSCADAEAQGILVTEGYVLNAGTRAAPAPTPAPAPTLAPVGDPVRAEISAIYSRFVAAQNAHDRAAVAELLAPSDELLVVPADGRPIWGRQASVEAFAADWERHSTWEAPGQAPRIAIVAPDVAVLTAPRGGTVPARFSGVFVKTRAGWRIASVFMTPGAGAPSAADQ